MFDIGFSELIVIAVVALVVIGPERLPKVARTIGHLLGKAQRYVNDVKTEINREMEIDELRRLQAEMQDAARKLETNVHQTMRETEESVQKSVKSIEDDVAELEAMPLASASPSSSATSATTNTAAKGNSIEMQGPPVAAAGVAVQSASHSAIHSAIQPTTHPIAQAMGEDPIKLDPSDYNPAEKDGPILLSDAGPEAESQPTIQPTTQAATSETASAGPQKS
jgi:sec-independent protein translocase protein TatB